MMQSDFTNTHVLLLTGIDFDECKEKVLHYFDRNVLVKYDRVDIVADESFNAGRNGHEFQEALVRALAENSSKRAGLIHELTEEGYGDLAGWQDLPQGYVSKIVHTLAHMVDGFFGVDSALYNLINDSHHVPDALMDSIRQNPEEFWLIKVIGRTSSGQQTDRIGFLRKHGKE